MVSKSSPSRRKDGTRRPIAELAEAGGDSLPHYHGHRQRLRERFLNGGRDALPDYELLELLLFIAIPRVDTKPLAKSLIDGMWGDPSGDYKGQEGERTPFMIFRAVQLPIMPAPGQSLSIRIGAVENVLNRMVNGYPGMLVSPTCTTFKAGMAGGYKFRQLRVSGRDVYADEPEKNNFSHICDAGQYLLVGGGEGRILTTGTSERPKAVNTVRHVNVLGRGPGNVKRAPMLVRR